MLSSIAHSLMTASRSNGGKPVADYRDELRHKHYLHEQRRREAKRQHDLAFRNGHS
jgi:hypothetical protein